VEGLANGRLSALQASFLEHGAVQCGICTPGLLVAATALLERNPRPCETEVKDAPGGVLCRCTGYRKVIAAVMAAWTSDSSSTSPLRGGVRGGGNTSISLPPPLPPPLKGEEDSCAYPSIGQAVGARIPRLDGVPKVTGEEKFGGDSFPADALSVLVVRSPHHRARFALGDLDAYVRSQPGI